MRTKITRESKITIFIEWFLSWFELEREIWPNICEIVKICEFKILKYDGAKFRIGLGWLVLLIGTDWAVLNKFIGLGSN